MDTAIGSPFISTVLAIYLQSYHVLGDLGLCLRWWDSCRPDFVRVYDLL